jgi:hypothetical protein
MFAGIPSQSRQTRGIRLPLLAGMFSTYLSTYLTAAP